MSYKAIIFDLDGVICHTDRYHYEAWKSLADKLGIYFDETINNRLRGVSRMESLEIILEKYEGAPLSPEQKEKFAEEKNNIYKDLLKNMTPNDLDEDVKETLETLQKHSFLLAIGSSSKNAKFILSQLGITDFFDAVADGNDIQYSKPNPEVFLKAAKDLGIHPENCLVVEDARSGVEAALAGNMDCAGIGEASLYQGVHYSLETLKDVLLCVGIK